MSSAGDLSNAVIRRGENPGTSRQSVAKRMTAKHRRGGSNAPKSRPAFVEKLWSMVNDEKNHEHIRWMPDGKAFQVLNRENFEREVLPIYFKHSNFSSFVRQLNMYGWHKIQDVTSGAMQGGDETWKFQSPYFIRGREDLLDNIVRNKGGRTEDDEEEVTLAKILRELSMIKENQAMIGNDLLRLKEDNQLLWRENIQQRERHKRYSDTLDRILRFLASLYGQNRFLSDVINTSPHKTNQKLIMQNPETQRAAQISEIQESHNNSKDAINNNEDNPVNDRSTAPNLEELLDFAKFPMSPDTQNRISSISSAATTPKGTEGGSPKPSSNTATTAGANPSMSAVSPGTIQPSLDSFPTQLVPYDNSSSVQTPRQLFPELMQGAAGPSIGNGATANDGTDEGAYPGLHDAAGLGEPTDNSDLIATNGAKAEELAKHLDLQGSSLQQVEELLHRYMPQYTASLKHDPTDANANINYDDFLVDPTDHQYANDYEDAPVEPVNEEPTKKRKLNE